MRLFAGIDIPPEVKRSLHSLINKLRPAAKLRWSPVDNLHITTKFIGSWPDERLEDMKSTLQAITGIGPFDIAIRGLGWFPNPHHPRIFWAAVRAPESLAALAKATEEAAFSLGIEKETRPYSPHLTLARIDGTPDLAEIRRRIAGLDSDDFGEFRVSEFHLYLSERSPSGSVYTKLASFPLKSL
jgi:2'-5' RNA ligase